MKFLPYLAALLLFLPGCPAPCPAAPLTADQRKVVEQLDRIAKDAEARAVVSDQKAAQAQTDLAAAKQSEAEAGKQIDALGKVAATAEQARAKAVQERDAATKSKHHAWELLIAMLLTVLILASIAGAQIQTVLDAAERTALHAAEAVGGEAVSLVEKVPWVAGLLLKLAPIAALV